MADQQHRLKASYRPSRAISPADVLAMHALFVNYYENADPGTFVKDLSEKDGAILVRDEEGILRGFTTVRTMPMWDGEREVLGVFSGDTILDPCCWGDRTLKDAFAKHMLSLKLRRPGRPMYWLLISKGYKTYLLLANNFTNYYPRHDRPNDPKLERLVSAYCEKLFPGSYDRNQKVLDFGDGYQRLRGEVAPITTSMRLENPAINYFERRNPEWHRGVELPCIGELSVSLLWPYLAKQAKKQRDALRGAPVRESGFYTRPTPPDRPVTDEAPFLMNGTE